jgi:hypothetical protein
MKSFYPGNKTRQERRAIRQCVDLDVFVKRMCAVANRSEAV